MKKRLAAFAAAIAPLVVATALVAPTSSAAGSPTVYELVRGTTCVIFGPDTPSDVESVVLLVASVGGAWEDPSGARWGDWSNVTPETGYPVPTADQIAEFDLAFTKASTSPFTGCGTVATQQVQALSSSFLCYSVWGQPMVVRADQYDSFIRQGYWKPLAVPGQLDGGQNIGDYHLDCAKRSVTASGPATIVDSSGETTTVASFLVSPGFYQIAP